ncbi:hypothetical protein ACFVT1_17160 [Streptomyces sp. NPDC057963]|uniref:hypothetical protein n=1 Tax=Streptomyces sp. NPDC057963 TaxID=3346290 RepID=UPI0036EB4F3B
MTHVNKLAKDDRFSAGVPWGVMRIESPGSDWGIPEIDPLVSPAESNPGCIVVAVVHDDIGPVEVTVGVGDRDAPGELIFDGSLEVRNGVVEIADLVGTTFCHQYQVGPDRFQRIRVFADDPEEAQKLSVRFVEES